MIERHEEEKIVVEYTEQLSVEEEVKREEVELAEKKPVDANSEIVPNKNLTDDEIAQLILEEEELLSDQGLLGYIFTNVESTCEIKRVINNHISLSFSKTPVISTIDFKRSLRQCWTFLFYHFRIYQIE